ncbi:MAG: exodeoxyribonuclease VII large subunit [Anaerolineales bacterium]
MDNVWRSFETTVWSVIDLTRYVRQLLESDFRLQELWVVGEVSNVSRPSSGHLYFTLKDDQASLRCVMWRPQVLAQTHLPQDGERLEVFGRIGLYEAGGQYQLYAERLRPAGSGELFQAFLRLKAHLEAEGLFDPARKRELPAWPDVIGVATSPTGAALRDVVHVLRRRFPLARVLLAPTPVQGDAAPPGIVAALDLLNRDGRSKVILLVRGGGSMEDLWSFNEEAVVRAVAASSIPVVSGVGHETDLVLTDLAADVRAATPSAAAEVAVPDQANLREAMRQLRSELQFEFGYQLQERAKEWRQLHARLLRASPLAHIANARQRVDELSLRGTAAIRHRLALAGSTVSGLAQTLRAVSPQAVLERGYAIAIRTADGKIVSSTRQVKIGEALQVRVKDGTIGTQVTDR